jgi:hypothetical protein
MHVLCTAYQVLKCCCCYRCRSDVYVNTTSCCCYYCCCRLLVCARYNSVNGLLEMHRLLSTMPCAVGSTHCSARSIVQSLLWEVCVASVQPPCIRFRIEPLMLLCCLVGTVEFWCRAVSGDEVLEGSMFLTVHHFCFTAPYNNQTVTVCRALCQPYHSAMRATCCTDTPSAAVHLGCSTICRCTGDQAYCRNGQRPYWYAAIPACRREPRPIVMRFANVFSRYVGMSLLWWWWWWWLRFF